VIYEIRHPSIDLACATLIVASQSPVPRARIVPLAATAVVYSARRVSAGVVSLFA
jgi:hypothetical protein